MKKLMIAAAIVCAAVASQAASIKWSSGAIYTPDASGALSTTKLTTASGYTLEAFAWESSSSFEFASGSLYNWYSGGKKGQAITGIDALPSTATSITLNGSGANAFVTGNDLGEGNTVYGAVLYVLVDSKSGSPVWYMENSGAKQNGKSVQTVGNLATKIGGNGITGTTTSTAWQSVPEPTSGLLLLLGVAGLALRRRRA